MRKSMLFDGSEPCLALYSSLISHFCHFRKTLKNPCKKGCQKSLIFVQKRDLGAQGSIDSTILGDFWGFKKSLIFGCRSWASKIRKKSVHGVLWRRFAVKDGESRIVGARQGPPGSRLFARSKQFLRLEIRLINDLRDLTRLGPVARRIL